MQRKHKKTVYSSASAKKPIANSAKARLSLSKKTLWQAFPLVLVILGLSISFIYGWYYDTSTPQSGEGWADQSVYASAAGNLAQAEPLEAEHMHYAIGYPLLGAVGHYIVPADPFVPVAMGLLLASAVLCFLAVRTLFGRWWAVAFCALLFYWDGVARTLHHSSEIFVVPWNNQVLFFAFAFLFWLFVTKIKTAPSWRLVAVAGLVAGFTFITREESILFMAPALAVYFLITRANYKKWLVCFGIIAVCWLPQAAAKMSALGSVSESGHDASYSETIGNYLQPAQLYRNTWEVLINSNHYDTSDQVQRPALLQAVPWLWLSPLGLLAILLLRRYPLGLKVFVIISLALMVFYLSGANMSAQKLQFHCLRYISPAFIALNLGIIALLHMIYTALKAARQKTRPPV